MNSHIGDFVTFAKGKPPKETFEQPQPGMLPYLSPEYLRGVAQPLWVKPASSSVHVDDGEPIILWDGSNAGEIFSAKRGVLASTMAVARPKDPELDFRYLGFALKLHEERLRGFTAGSGIPHVDKSIVKRLSFRKPELLEQRAITSALESIKEQLETTESTLVAAEKMAQGLMQNLLHGRITVDGTVRPVDEFTTHSKLGLIPRKWQALKGRSLFKLHGAYFPNSLDFVSEPDRADCLFMKVEDFNHRLNAARIVRTEISLHLGDQARKFRSCKPGWLVIAKRGAAILHNRVRLLTRATLLDPNLMAIEMLEDHSPEYFRYLLTHMNLSRFLEVSSVPQLNNKDLYPRWFMMPPTGEQAEIATAIFDYERLIEAKRAKITALQRLKKSLMQNLLTGRMRLSPEAIAELTAEAGKSDGA